MIGFRDIHAHFVYGVDDGAQSREDMYAMLDLVHKDGVTDLCATPHVTPGVKPFDGLSFNRHFEMAQAYCKEKGYPITLHAGAEILYTPAIDRYAEEGQLPTLGNTRFVLIEFVPDIAYSDIIKAVDLIEHTGYRLIIAHIERYNCMFRGNAQRIKDEHEVLYQVNCSTVIERKRFRRDREIRDWFKNHMIDYVASDQHNTTSRRTRLTEAYNVLEEEYGARYAGKLLGLNRKRPQTEQ